MNQELQILHTQHFLAESTKLENWGRGEWIEEPELCIFQYRDYICKVSRMFWYEYMMTGGQLNGYVKIPSGHPYENKEYQDMNIDCHGGLTYSQFSEEAEKWIGFDSSHWYDYTPGDEALKRKNLGFQKMEKIFGDSPIFHREYRNLQYCIVQCCQIVDQLIEIQQQNKKILNSQN